MGTISVQVHDEKDFKMVMAMLKALEEIDILSIRLEDEESLAVPGEPVTDEKLLEEIEKAEASGDISGEEAKIFFKVLRKPESETV